MLAAACLIATGVIDIDGDDSDRLPPDWQRGMNLTAFLPDAYATDDAKEALETAKATGTSIVALTPTSYMANATATEIEPDPAKTPTDESVLAVASRAHELGLEVAIKPHVDVLDGTFRGEIRPGDASAWFASYGSLVDRYADIAARARAEVLVIGTELTSMSDDQSDADEWRSLIARARQRFDGKITFAANWVQGAEEVGFWNALDYVGIDAYMPLRTQDELNPSVDALVDAWRPYVTDMRKLSERWERPVLITELGYESRPGTAAGVDQGSGQVDEAAQANAYEAAFRVLSKQDWMAGIWWWEWSAERIGIGPSDAGFNPEGKQAEQVLKDWQT